MEVYAGDDTNIDFYLVGYWSNPPGTYAETAGVSFQHTNAGNWQDQDLSSYGVAANAVVTLVMANSSSNSEERMGVRELGSSIDRYIQLHEAESGGADMMTFHVTADAGSNIQSYSGSTGSAFRHRLVGWWER